MKPEHKRLVKNKREDWLEGLMLNVTAQGDVLRIENEGIPRGAFCMSSVDSMENGFAWRRVTLDARVPADGLMAVYAMAADVKLLPDGRDLDMCLSGGELSWEELRELFGAPVSYSDDFYVNRAGRYLWLMFEFVAAGSSPELSGVAVHFPGDHMLSYLPPIYRDDFTYRFLSVFDSFLMDMERAIEELPRRFDHESAEPEMLHTLASWLGVDADCTEDELRQRIGTAVSDHEELYTVSGVARSVERLTGRRPLIIEHFAVDANDPKCRDPEALTKLYGSDPYRFFVLLPEDTFPGMHERELFIERMSRLIPAHTQMELVLLKKCVQLGWHSYLGVNSYVGSYLPVKIDESTTIHYDSMIGGDAN